MKVFISTSTFAENDRIPLELLDRAGIEYDLNPHGCKFDEKGILKILSGGSYAGLVAGTEPLTARVMQAAASLRVISRVGVGLDNVDCEAAANNNIVVYNTPEVLTDAVAELTLGLILNCLRKISFMDGKLRKGIWKKEMGCLLKGKVLGIIGFGNIGRRVTQLAKGFGVGVIFYDLNRIESDLGQYASLDEVCSAADIISLHLSSKERIFTRNSFSLMKDGVVIINTSRGSAYDEDVLFDALVSGKVSCAGLDVYEHEPYTGKFLELDNVVLTPHVGSYAREARILMERQAVENLVNGLKNEEN